MTPAERLARYGDLAVAWQEHVGELERRVAALERHRLDAVRFRRPGTDLTG